MSISGMAELIMLGFRAVYGLKPVPDVQQAAQIKTSKSSKAPGCVQVSYLR
jgi:hypothetical protein